MSSKATEYPRLVEAAKRYARADRTDPFAMRRAMVHIKNGVAGGTSTYNAEEFMDERRSAGSGGGEVRYATLAHCSVVRP